MVNVNKPDIIFKEAYQQIYGENIISKELSQALKQDSERNPNSEYLKIKSNILLQEEYDLILFINMSLDLLNDDSLNDAKILEVLEKLQSKINKCCDNIINWMDMSLGVLNFAYERCEDNNKLKNQFFNDCCNVLLSLSNMFNFINAFLNSDLYKYNQYMIILETVQFNSLCKLKTTLVKISYFNNSELLALEIFRHCINNLKNAY
ncbi:hypothetical protein AB837_00005 [bacterium AB1]|nr:hypothetical protein AB837_00005 [bacterium AB1]